MNMKSGRSSIVFLKLGGSLITDKQVPMTARGETIRRLAKEVAGVFLTSPNFRLVLGHGSGSFGHVPARRYGTRSGVHTAEEWHGFIEVWQAAAALNRLVVDTFSAAGLPVIPFPPSAGVTADDGRIAVWNTDPIEAALAAGLLPVVFGDVVFDRARGGTILSTEDLFEYLVPVLAPERVLLAGLEAGVCADFPGCRQVIPMITPSTSADLLVGLGGSAAPDVTGGMAAKVALALRMVEADPDLEVVIFSGEIPGLVAGELSRLTTSTRTRVTANPGDPN